MISIPAPHISTTESHIEDRAALCPRTIDNDFGEVVTRKSVHNEDALVKDAIYWCASKGAGDAMDTRRTISLIQAGKFSDSILRELIELWRSF